MDKEKIQEVAFRLIAYAGDAYSSFQNAVKKAREGEFDQAECKMEEGRKQLVNAHNTQTELLTAETQGEELAYSILMVHAQDYLMNAIMFESVAEELIYLHKERQRGNHS